jgi:TolA-binding protein
MLYRSSSLDLFKSSTYGLVSEPGESEGEFRVRLGERAREARDEEIAELRRKSRSKVAALEERIRKARQKVEVQSEQVSQQRMRTAINFGSTLLAAFTGRSYRGSAGSALGSLGRTAKEKQDVKRAQETVETLTAELEERAAELEARIDELEDRFDPQAEKLTTQSVRPRKSDIEVRLVALAWCPYRRDGLEPAWG